jgi:hypothetical protein
MAIASPVVEKRHECKSKIEQRAREKAKGKSKKKDEIPNNKLQTNSIRQLADQNNPIGITHFAPIP